ncbi:MAG: FKBP-type peptidyl-prolyl cis-trans isomerase [Fluviicola sp.]|nr:FKBP-type peptidyl-prolyl cis-trans isomerase [Fluviicola sp.]
MKLITTILLIFTLLSCDTTGVKKNTADNPSKDDASLVKEEVKANVLDQPAVVIDKEELGNGVIIKWIEHGKGELVKKGDMVQIDYKVFLEDNDVVDGNHLIGKESIPFMVGFQMQTKGWDIALQKLKVGDYAEVFIPSELARGEKGIKDVIPPNADNILKIRIIEKVKPTREVDGNKVWVFEENASNKLLFGEKTEIEFHSMVSTPSNPLYVNTYRGGAPFKLRLNDSGTVPGLKKALINAKKADRMFILIPSTEGYGNRGYQKLVKPNEDLFYNIFVMDVVKI